jgi:hypothetical protein
MEWMGDLVDAIMILLSINIPVINYTAFQILIFLLVMRIFIGFIASLFRLKSDSKED